MTGDSFRAHLSAIGISEIIARSAQFGVLALAARNLSASSFGVYGLAVAIHQLSLAIVQTGPELHATRLVAQGLGGRGLVLRLAAFKGGLAVAAYLAVIVIVAGAYGDPALTRQVAIQGLLLPIAALNAVWVIKATSRFGPFAVARSGQSLLFLAIAAAMLSYSSSPLSIPCAEAAATGTIALLSLPFGLRLAGRQMGAVRQPLLFPSLALGFSGLCAEAVWSMPLTVGGLFLSAGAVGLVAGAGRILTALNAVFQMLFQVFYPALARRYAQDMESGRGLAGSLLVCSAATAAILIAIGSAFADPLVGLLLGQEKAAVAPVLRLCIWALGPAFAGTVAGYALLAAGHHRLFTRLAVVATILAALTAVVGYGLAPRPEMAATQVISQTAYAAMLLAVASRKRLIGWAGISWTLLRPSGLRHLLSQR